jgi:hypothetical protein
MLIDFHGDEAKKKMMKKKIKMADIMGVTPLL